MSKKIGFIYYVNPIQTVSTLSISIFTVKSRTIAKLKNSGLNQNEKLRPYQFWCRTNEPNKRAQTPNLKPFYAFCEQKNNSRKEINER